MMDPRVKHEDMLSVIVPTSVIPYNKQGNIHSMTLCMQGEKHALFVQVFDVDHRGDQFNSL